MTDPAFQQLQQQVVDLTAAFHTASEQNQLLQQQLAHQQLLLTQLQQQPPSPRHRQPPKPRMDQKLPNPSKFDGTRSKFCDFCTACNVVIEANPSFYINDSTKTNFIAALLEGSALTWYSTWSASNPLATYNQFVAALTTAFDDSERRQKATIRLQTIKQRSRPIQDYISDFRHSAVDCDLNASAQVMFFLAGLDSNIGLATITAPTPATLDAAFNLAASIDTRLKLIHHPGPNPHTNPLAHPHDPMEVNAQHRGPLTDKEKDYRRKHNLCLYCGKPDHRVIACPLKPNRSKKTISVVTENKPDEPYTSVSCPRTNITLHHTPSSSLIDSGASLSVIDKDWVLRHNIPTERSKDRFNVFGVGGESVGTPLSTTALTGQIGSYQFQQQFCVIRSPNNPIILGLDWLKAHNPDIDWSLGKIRSFRGHTYDSKLTPTVALIQPLEIELPTTVTPLVPCSNAYATHKSTDEEQDGMSIETGGNIADMTAPASKVNLIENIISTVSIILKDPACLHDLLTVAVEPVTKGLPHHMNVLTTFVTRKYQMPCLITVMGTLLLI